MVTHWRDATFWQYPGSKQDTWKTCLNIEMLCYGTLFATMYKKLEARVSIVWKTPTHQRLLSGIRIWHSFPFYCLPYTYWFCFYSRSYIMKLYHFLFSNSSYIYITCNFLYSSQDPTSLKLKILSIINKGHHHTTG